MKKLRHTLLAALSLAVLVGAASCSEADNASPGGSDIGDGQGGSMARFAIMGDHMYVVDHSTLKTIRLTDPAHPEHLKHRDQRPDGWGSGDIETIFPDRERNLLFIGSRSAMFIYDASSPEFIRKSGTASHITSCDPVVAYGDYAYVTLNADNSWRCGSRGNQLNIYDISYLNSPDAGKPILRRSIDMSNPMGLGIDGGRERLFVCSNGMTMYDISNPVQPVAIDDLHDSTSQIQAGIVDSYDVIPMTDKAHLLLVGRNGLFQFDYGDDKLSLLDFILVDRH